jgi:hypothetical protein
MEDVSVSTIANRMMNAEWTTVILQISAEKGHALKGRLVYKINANVYRTVREENVERMGVVDGVVDRVPIQMNVMMGNVPVYRIAKAKSVDNTMMGAEDHVVTWNVHNLL